ncbi:MAG: flavin monoamine oxidase family protein [Planctomycetia bacterium]
MTPNRNAGLSRRDLLLGAASVAVGCARTGGRPFSGGFVGPSPTVGHRMRDFVLPTPTAGLPVHRVKTLVVGGGVAGLSCGWRLVSRGVDDFVVLELEDAPGGTARGATAAGFAYPLGAHYLPLPTGENPELIRLLEEIGAVVGRDADGEPIAAEEALCRDPVERLFVSGAWWEGLEPAVETTEADRADQATFQAEVGRWVEWRDAQGRRAFALPSAAGSDDPEVTVLDRLSMAEWLERKGWRSPRLRWLVDYACRDDYGLRVEQTSAWAGMFYFAARMRRAGGEPQPLLTWPEGNARLVAHLAKQCGDRVRLGWAAAAVTPADGAGVDVLAVDSAGSAAVWRAERVVLAAPRFVARRLLRFHPAWALPDGDGFEYGSWLTANLFLRRRPAERSFPAAWDNVLYDSPSLGYVVATHQQDRDHGPTVWTYYLPLTDGSPLEIRRRLLALTWEEAADAVLADLSRAHPDLPELVDRLDVARWAHAMIQPRPGFVWSDARRRAAEPRGPIHFANTDLSGIPLFEEAFHHGLRAADEVVAAVRG